MFKGIHYTLGKQIPTFVPGFTAQWVILCEEFDSTSHRDTNSSPNTFHMLETSEKWGLQNNNIPKIAPKPESGIS